MWQSGWAEFESHTGKAIFRVSTPINMRMSIKWIKQAGGPALNLPLQWCSAIQSIHLWQSDTVCRIISSFHFFRGWKNNLWPFLSHTSLFFTLSISVIATLLCLNLITPGHKLFCFRLCDCCDGAFEINLEKNNEHEGNNRKYVHGAIYLLIMPFQMLSSCSVIAHEKGCIISEGLMLFVVRLKTVFAERRPQISLVSEGSLISDRNPNRN